MTGFPTFDVVSATLLSGLLGFAAGQAFGRRRERERLDRQLEQESERALRETRLWHQRVQLRRGPEDATQQERSDRP